MADEGATNGSSIRRPRTRPNGRAPTARRAGRGPAGRRLGVASRAALLRPREIGGARAMSRKCGRKSLVRRQLTHIEALVERLGEADRHIVRRAFADMARNVGAKAH